MSAVAARRPRLPRVSVSRTAALVAAAVLAVWAWVAVEAHAGRALDALPDTLRAGAATVIVFAATGYPLARALLPAELLPHLAVAVLPLGAASSSLALTMIAGVGVPFEAALGLVLAGGAVGCVVAHRRHRSRAPDRGALERAGGPALRVGWPAYVAVVLAGLALLPVFRVGMPTVLGENPDAHLVTGAAEVVREGPPASVQPELPVDRVSPFWRSKYPIYYSLAAIATLSGLDPIAVFPVLSAALLALFAAGVFLFAFHALRAPPTVALLAMGFTALDRVVLYVVDHPYYNQLWGLVALPFMLLFGFRFLRQPDRQSAALTLLFLAIGVLAYPLMLPFPAVALGVAALLLWRRKRARGEPLGWLAALRLPSLRGRRLVLAPVVAASALVGLLLLAAAIDKGIAAAGVIFGGSLNGWQGDSPSIPFPRFFGVVDVAGIAVVGLVGVLLAAIAGLRRLPREERLGLAAMAIGALAMAAQFDARLYGEYFYFKILAFLGPVVLALAVVGAAGLAAARRPRTVRVVAVAGLAAFALGLAVNARNELEGVAIQAPAETFELRDWADRLPAAASIRLDLPPTGNQLWAAYMLHEQPLSATTPILATTYPAVFPGRKAEYVLVEARQPRPADAVGGPVMANPGFRLYRLDPTLRGPDRSSRKRIQP